MRKDKHLTLSMSENQTEREIEIKGNHASHIVIIIIKKKIWTQIVQIVIILREQCLSQFKYAHSH